MLGRDPFNGNQPVEFTNAFLLRGKSILVSRPVLPVRSPVLSALRVADHLRRFLRRTIVGDQHCRVFRIIGDSSGNRGSGRRGAGANPRSGYRYRLGILAVAEICFRPGWFVFLQALWQCSLTFLRFPLRSLGTASVVSPQPSCLSLPPPHTFNTAK